MKNTINAKLVAKLNGSYTTYVFQNLEEQESSESRYITVTKCPNWQYYGEINIGDEGFLEYEFVKAGDEYFDLSSNKTECYRYTRNYFMNFIKQTKDNTKEYIF